MAPERFSGRGDVRSDVYGLGLTLYELLTLRPAFDETDREQARQAGDARRAAAAAQAQSRTCRATWRRWCSRRSPAMPAHRYQTPAELAEDLRRFVDGPAGAGTADQRRGEAVALVPPQSSRRRAQGYLLFHTGEGNSP